MKQKRVRVKEWIDMRKKYCAYRSLMRKLGLKDNLILQELPAHECDYTTYYFSLKQFIQDLQYVGVI